MTLDEFNKKYIYKSDNNKFGFFEVWEIPKLEEDGFYYGDCESYCLFLKNNIEQFKNFDLYYCKLNGVGHCILSDGVVAIDCNIKRIILLDSFIKKYSIVELRKYNKFTILCKCLFAKLFLLIKK